MLLLLSKSAQTHYQMRFTLHCMVFAGSHEQWLNGPKRFSYLIVHVRTVLDQHLYKIGPLVGCALYQGCRPTCVLVAIHMALGIAIQMPPRLRGAVPVEKVRVCARGWG